MSLLTLFARKVVTNDPVDLALGGSFKKRMDTVLYRDPECTKPAARWPWHYSDCPRKGQKKVMFNCYWWNLEWVV